MNRAVLVVLLLWLAGCGGSDAESDPSDDDSGGIASCSSVWVEGQKLPEDYAVCKAGPDGPDDDDGYWICDDETEIWLDGASNTFASAGATIRSDENDALYDELERCGALAD